jgi:hypothetical protein
MRAVLNEHTMTVHKHDTGGTALHTECGVTHHLDPDRLRAISVRRATADHGADKCGRCFDDGNGY